MYFSILDEGQAVDYSKIGSTRDHYGSLADNSFVLHFP